MSDLFDELAAAASERRALLIDTASDEERRVAIERAAWHGSSEIVELLIARGVSFDETSDQIFTPLTLAAKGGHLEIVKRLIALGASPDGRGKQASHPLDQALSFGEPVRRATAHERDVVFPEIIRRLVDAGAQIDFGDYHSGIRKAAATASAATFAMLIARVNPAALPAALRASITATIEPAAKIESVLARGSQHPEIAFEVKRSLIELLACYHDDHKTPPYLDLTDLLLVRGADVNASTDANVTPLLLAVRKGLADVAARLLERGASPDAETSQRDYTLEIKKGSTPRKLAEENEALQRLFEGYKKAGKKRAEAGEPKFNGVTATRALGAIEAKKDPCRLLGDDLGDFLWYAIREGKLAIETRPDLWWALKKGRSIGGAELVSTLERTATAARIHGAKYGKSYFFLPGWPAELHAVAEVVAASDPAPVIAGLERLPSVFREGVKVALVAASALAPAELEPSTRLDLAATFVGGCTDNEKAGALGRKIYSAVEWDGACIQALSAKGGEVYNSGAVRALGPSMTAQQLVDLTRNLGTSYMANDLMLPLFEAAGAAAIGPLEAALDSGDASYTAQLILVVALVSALGRRNRSIDPRWAALLARVTASDGAKYIAEARSFVSFAPPC